MEIVIDTREGAEFEGARRIAQLIGRHGKEMTAAALDRALNLWDTLLKSGLKTTSTVETQRRTGNQNTEEEKMEKSRKDALLAQARAFTGLGIPPRQAAEMALRMEGTGQKLGTELAMGKLSRIERTSAGPSQPSAQSAKRHIPWGARPRLWGQEQIMVDDTPLPGPQAPQVVPQQPLGPAAFGYEKRRDLSKLTGHQRVGLSLGVDLDKVSAAELGRMDKGQMEALARQQLLEKLAEQRNSQLASRPASDTPWFKNGGFWR